jgi:hypothetical protein
LQLIFSSYYLSGEIYFNNMDSADSSRPTRDIPP